MTTEIQAPPTGPDAKVSTTDTGAPAPSDQFSLSVGADGPLLLHDFHFVNQMAHFDRERVPERVVHAKGSGAFGTFQTTGDVSRYTKAALFQPGVKTDMLARFSTVAGELGSADTVRDPRGFALKFYTSEGNWDLVGNNTPIFFVRDAMKFPHFIRTQKRQPDSGLQDWNMRWDFWTLSPESAHQVTYLMGDRGIPKTWRHMNGYGSHTYLWVNAEGVALLGEVQLPLRPGRGQPHQRGGGADRGDRPRRAPPRPVRLDQRGGLPQLDAQGAGDAVRGRQDLPVQPVRSDQGVAARGLPGDRGRHHDLEPQPGQPLRPDRAGILRAQRPGAGHRLQPGQDAARAGSSPTPTPIGTGSGPTITSCR